MTPTLIVIGKDGSIVGMGNSIDEIDKVLARQLATRREPVFLKKHMSKRVVKSDDVVSHAIRSSFFANDNVSRRFDKVDRLAESGEYNKALRELDSLGSENPSLQPIIQHRKFTLLLRVNEEEAYALARTMLAGSFKDDSFVLDEMAWQIVDDKSGLISPDYNTAIELARRAVQLDLSEDPLSLDTLAYAYFKKGDVERAVELGEMAAQQLKSRSGLPDSRLKEITSHLALYKRKVQ